MITKTRSILDSITFTEYEKDFLRQLADLMTNECQCRSYDSDRCINCPFYDVHYEATSIECTFLADALRTMANNGVKNSLNI